MRSLKFLGLVTIILSAGADEGFVTIFDGSTPSGWKTNKGELLPAGNVQADGLNPHGSGGYIVVYDQPKADFVLDFDYKLSKGCNSGVFLRVGDLKDPVYTGLEIAIDDTTGTGVHDTGAIYDLVAPTKNTQKPVGEWNHMTITAKGPKISVSVNQVEVSSIDLDRWTQAGKRPDGSSHKFKDLVVKELNRPGYFGFQDHGQDCWFKNVKIKDLK